MTEPIVIAAAPPPSGERRYDLDWIRIGAFLLLIFYHVGLFYAGWDWHVKSPRASGALDAFLMIPSPWRLGLLFLVSGSASRFMLDRMGPGGFVQGRIKRLVPPFVFAIFLIVPPQSYFELLGREGGVPSWSQYWHLYAEGLFKGPGGCVAGACIPAPTYNHMWFVGYILLYSLILWGLALTLPRLREGVSWLERYLTGWRVILIPFCWLAMLRMVLFPHLDFAHDLPRDLYGHAVYFSLFLFGFLTAKSPVIADRLMRWRWWAAGAWVASFGLYLAYIWAWHGRGIPSPYPVDLLARVDMAAQQWMAVAAILGFGHRWLTRDHPLRRYLTLAVFPFYIVHQTLIIVLAYGLSRMGLPILVEAGLILGLTILGCLATYEVARRVPGLGILFGLRRQARPQDANRPPRPA